jgi:hypothetical protein
MFQPDPFPNIGYLHHATHLSPPKIVEMIPVSRIAEVLATVSVLLVLASQKPFPISIYSSQ